MTRLAAILLLLTGCSLPANEPHPIRDCPPHIPAKVAPHKPPRDGPRIHSVKLQARYV